MKNNRLPQEPIALLLQQLFNVENLVEDDGLAGLVYVTVGVETDASDVVGEALAG